MMKIFLFLLLAIYKNHCQIKFGQTFSTNIPTRSENQKEFLSEDAILYRTKVLNGDLSGTLPQQVFIRVRDI
jgi:hypothetical protein